jgi:hypothetical protein
MTHLRKLVAACNKFNLEVFYLGPAEARYCTKQALTQDTRFVNAGETVKPGWYWWSCVPGCLPDSEWATGPFTSATRAAGDALDTRP